MWISAPPVSKQKNNLIVHLLDSSLHLHTGVLCSRLMDSDLAYDILSPVTIMRYPIV